MGALLGLGGVGVLLLRSPTPSAPPAASTSPLIPSVPTLSPPLPPPAPEPPAEVAVTEVLSNVTPFTSDVDGDQKLELIVGIESALAGASTKHFAVFDPHNGRERARTPAIEDLDDFLVAARGGRLVLAGKLGQLVSYDLVSGDLQWNSTLGDRATTLCEARAADALHVDTADNRHLLIDLTTGRQTETRDACGRVLARDDSDRDPRDRHDYTAPAGVDAYHCGNVRVMGSENFSVSDQCNARAHINSERLDGMVGHRIWKTEGGWLVFGVRQPGAYVPMVGRLGRGSAFVWKSEVPVSNPLQADTGGPRHVAIVGDALLVAYQMNAEPRSMLTSFALADGVRRFALPVSTTQRVTSMVPVGDALAVQIGDGVQVLAAADGSVRTTIGAAP